MHTDIERILIDSTSLAQRVSALGQQITVDYAGKSIVLVGILKGAVVFMADLARAIDLPCALDFMSVSSYGNTTQSQGIIRILKDLDEPIQGKHVVVVEDILDSGLTLNYLLDSLRRRDPASLRLCTLLDKQKARTIQIDSDYIGFNVPDEFVVGYGLDYAQHYRNLPYIGVLKPAVYSTSNTSN